MVYEKSQNRSQSTGCPKCRLLKCKPRMTEEIPQLVSLNPSENATAIFDDVVNDFEPDEKEPFEDKLPHEYRVSVVFQKKLKEKDLWNAFGWILEQREQYSI
jgi:hypothetical protein